MGLYMNQSTWSEIAIYRFILNLVAVVIIEKGLLEKINST